ncbi:MAG: anaerobic ribonucleoside-triphosphate reductase activating protein [Desulfobacteraceae bacterium]|nr:anaerobic ribonucleoside-triphosphate reductase activating protein [Desulfobacteraceae bacterium]MBU4001060.1 anaerobic ribonucleoside-triphosphate reductase activating protein [Pseudomonadota bacterium]
MGFGGLQKTSLIDYPGKISCVVFVSGCNFHCPYCHNPDLIDPALKRYSQSGILDFLEKRRNFLDAVVVSGGEPTLQMDLLSFCKKIKSMGYSLKVDTNGSRPRVIRQLIKSGVVDYFAMDVKTLPHLYKPDISPSVQPETLLESIGLLMESGIEYEFRTTCAKPLVDEGILKDLVPMISGARRYVLQSFRQEGILSPDFFRTVEKQFTMDELGGFKNIFEKHVGECIIR